jgi:hypothetical protein
MTQAPAPWAGVWSWSSGGLGHDGNDVSRALFLLIVIGLFVGAIVWAVQAGSRRIVGAGESGGRRRSTSSSGATPAAS